MSTRRRRRRRRRNGSAALVVCTILLALAAAALVGAILWMDRGRQTSPTGGFSVRISEIMTDNTNCPDPHGALSDWVELENTSASDFDLSGYYLSDEEGVGKYAFPAGTRIPAGGYLVVWCDAMQTGDYAPFSLKKEGGETVCLMTANRVVMDRVTTVPCSGGQSLVRGPDGSLSSSGAPTPGYANTATGQHSWQQEISDRSGAALALNEIMTSNTLYSAPDGGFYDWVEIINPTGETISLSGYSLSDREGKSKYELSGASSLAPGEVLVIWCTAGGTGENLAPFALSSDGGESVILTGPAGSPVDSVEFPALEKNTSYVRTASGWEVSDRPTPGYANDDSGYTEYVSAVDYDSVPVYITELMAGNKGFCTDEDGDFSDWLELANLGEDTVDLTGWYLSDSEAELTKWQIPSLQLASGEYLRVWISGKGRVGTDGIHAGFSLAEGETAFLSAPNGVRVRSAAAVGAEEGSSLVLTEAGNYASCDFPTPGYPNDGSGYLAFCQQDDRTSPLLLWEIVVYDAKRNDWVELKNVSSEPVDTTGWTITDKKSEPARMSLPAAVVQPGQTLVVELQGFGLSAQRECVYLFDSQGRSADWAFLRGIPNGGSYGRMEGENGFFYFTSQTPGQDNGQGWRGVAAKPTADQAPGLYPDTSSLTVTLSGEDIYYTTDGSTPTRSATPYTGPIPISGVTILRAASLPEGQLGSDVLTLSYFLGESSTLPVVSLVTDQGNLFGPQGIYSHHEEAWAGDWERLANVSFYEDGGSFSIDCGIQMHGRTSRRVSEKKSFKLAFRGRYDGNLNYDVFGDGLITEFSSLLLRASVEDVYTSYMRDELFARLAMDNTDVLAQNYRYVTLYINGEYWGLYAIREHHSDNYFASHFGVDADTVEMQTGEFRKPGGWSDLLSYAEYNNLGSADAWNYIQEHLDVAEMIDWLILECWSGDIDVYENVRFYGSPEYNGGRYMYGLVDMDLTMMNHANTYTVGFTNIGQLHGIIPQALLSNWEFRDMFLTRLGELLQGGLSTQAVLDQIDKLQAIVEPEAARDLARWGQDGGTFAMQMDHLRNFTNTRTIEMIDSARGYFGLGADQVQKYFGPLL